MVPQVPIADGVNRSEGARLTASVPKVTVFIPVYNGERFLAEAIESVLAQTFADFELLIVDDGSTDSSVEIVERYADPRIRLERNERNRGRPYTRNRGLELARGEYVAVLDADDVCEPARLETSVVFLDENPDVVAVGSSATFIDDDGRSLFVARFVSDPDAIRASIFTTNCFLHSSVMFRRAALLAIGGYDEELPLSQDYDVFLRLSARHRLFNLETPLVRYRIHGAQVSQQKLVLQRQLADKARQTAYEKQRAEGLIGPRIRRPDFTLRGRLSGRDGTIAADLLYWASINRAMGNHRQAAILAVRALLNAPFSRRAWRAVRRSVPHLLFPPSTRSALRWYVRKALPFTKR